MLGAAITTVGVAFAAMILRCSFVLILITDLDLVHSRLRQLHIVFRHGERTPTETYINDPYRNISWSGGWGQLTNSGKLQMYSLGLKLRELYSDFIPEHYFPEDVSVSSSYADRCLMSAEVLMAGLFPPRGKQVWNEDLLWQPAPVRYVPRNQDNLIAMKAPCKSYDEEFRRVLKSEKVQKEIEENSDLLRYLTKNTGENISTIGDVELLYNTLEIELLNNLTLPQWTRNVSLEHMKGLAARSLEIFTETDQMKRLKGGVFLKHVTSLPERVEKGPTLYLYSGHDITLVNILKTLGYKSMLKPGFGASFIVEVRNDSSVSMIYRNDIESSPEEITLEACSDRCTLESFKLSLEAFLPSDWENECQQLP